MRNLNLASLSLDLPTIIDPILLDKYQVVEIFGDDSQKFLQGQLPTNLNSLQPGNHTLSCVTNHQGKVIAIFRLLVISSNQYWLIAREEELTAAINHLKKFAIFNKVHFMITDYRVSFSLNTKDQVLSNKEVGSFTSVQDNDGNLNLSFNLAQGCTFIVNKSSFANLDEITAHNIADPLSLVELHLLCQGIIKLDHSQREQYIAQAFGLETIEKTIAFNKGCYQGQEAIARAKYRGANRYSLQVFVLDRVKRELIGQQLQLLLQREKADNSFKDTGVIVDYIHYQNNTYLAAIIPSFKYQNNYLLDGKPLQLLYSSKVVDHPDDTN